MARRQINIASLDALGQEELMNVLAYELDQIFLRNFPPELGFEHSFAYESWSRRVSRGALWGLEASLHFNNAQTCMEVRIAGYFPVVRWLIAPFYSLLARVEQVPRIARGFVVKLLLPILLIPLVLALPLIVVYRLATLFLWKDARAAILQLEYTWPQIQASIARPVLLTATWPPWLVYLLSTTGFTIATWFGFWLTGQGEMVGAWKPLFLGLAVVLGLGSFILFLALVMTLLGFEVKV